MHRSKVTMWWAALAMLSQLCLPGCFVQDMCNDDSDCDYPQICSTQQRCELECVVDDECALEEICESNRCRAALQCASCAFAHAEAICRHGACSMGPCKADWYDLNSDPTDGCEYHCTPSNPGPEVCDGEDNDCDGQIDPETCECTPIGSTSDCPLQQGVCKETTRECLDDGTGRGVWQACDYAATAAAMGTLYEPLSESKCDGRDNDCDGETDEGICPLQCPDDMVAVENSYCMDRFEASHISGHIYPSSTIVAEELRYPGLTYCQAHPEDDRCKARSVQSPCDCVDAQDCQPGQQCIMPWQSVTLEIASAACQAGGKRLCSPAEWEKACSGPDETVYSYGDTYDAVICNGIDRYCENPEPGCFMAGQPTNPRLLPVGVLQECQGDLGIYDINGNTWEIVSDGFFRGGAYNCIDSQKLHQCSYEAVNIASRGFRCCKSKGEQ